MNERQNKALISGSDASMMGPPLDYGPGSYQSDRFDDRYNGYYGYGACSHNLAPSVYENAIPTPPAPDNQALSTPQSFTWKISDPTGRHFGKGPKSYRRSDQSILEDVSEALCAHPEIDASEIVVDVKDGVVTLSGAVESKQIKRLTEDTVETVSGVVEIKNRMAINKLTQRRDIYEKENQF